MRIGVIGTGTMGGLLVRTLIKSKAVRPGAISVTNRNKQKALDLAKQYHRLAVCESPADVLLRSDIIFLCVKPAQFYPLLNTLRGVWHPEQIAVSITSPIAPDQLESLISCRVARVVPSIVNESLSGSTLVTFGSGMTDMQKSRLWSILSQFSHPVEIDEENIRIAADLSSCGPAFLAFILQKMIDGAVRATRISRKQATLLVEEMLEGMGKLFENKIYSFEELQEKVTVRGGITGAGLEILEQNDQDTFEKLFRATAKKFIEEKRTTEKAFNQEDGASKAD